jgi:predicted branched-subunit amino acid permease
MNPSTSRSPFRSGVQAMLPILPGLLPAGIAVGSALRNSSVPPAAGLLSSLTVYGASAQLVVIDLAGRGTPPLLVVAVVALVSSRLALYGAALSRRLCGTGRVFRIVGPLVLVDPTFVVTDAGLDAWANPLDRRDFYLGAGLTLWVGWQLAHGAGLAFGALLPAGLALEFALPLCLLALLTPRLRDRPGRAAAVVAGVVAVAGAGWPVGTGLLTAAAAGAAAGHATRIGRSVQDRAGEVVG